MDVELSAVTAGKKISELDEELIREKRRKEPVVVTLNERKGELRSRDKMLKHEDLKFLAPLWNLSRESMNKYRYMTIPSS